MVEDLKTGSNAPYPTTLHKAEEAMGGCVSTAQAFTIGRLFLRVAAIDLAPNTAHFTPMPPARGFLRLPDIEARLRRGADCRG